MFRFKGKSFDTVDPRYPRKTWFRVLRLGLRLWWVAFAIYPANVIFNIYTIVGNDGIRSLPSHLKSALLLTQLLLFWQQSKWLIIVFFSLVVVLIVLGAWATRDQRRESRVLARREEQERHEEKAKGALASAESAAQLIAQRESLALVSSMTSTIVDQIGERLEQLKVPPPALPAVGNPPFDEALLQQPASFVGRQEELNWLVSRLCNDGVTSITALRGLGGIGKTTLVAVAVHQLRRQGLFQDGIVVILCQDLRNPVEVLKLVLARFDSERRQPEANDPATLLEVTHDLLDGKRALVVLDNIEPELDVSEVVNAIHAAGVALVLTSRHMPPRTTVDAGSVRTLDVLSSADAVDLFLQSLAGGSSNNLDPSEREVAERIVTLLGRHTLAVKLAGAYAADASRDLQNLCREIENDPLSVPDGETSRAVSIVLSRSIQGLPQEARHLFTALAAFPFTEFGRKAALSVSNALHLNAPDVLLNKLILRALVEPSTNATLPPESDRERLRLHPLVQALAIEEFSEWPEGMREDTLQAIADYYGRYTIANESLHSALSVDEININGALDWSHAHGVNELTIKLCIGMRSFWLDRWRTDSGRTYLAWALDAAQTLTRTTTGSINPLHRADLELTYGQLLWRLGEIEDAERVFRENLAIRKEINDRKGECEVYRCLGNLAWRNGRLEVADHYYGEALETAKEIRSRIDEGEILRSLGRVARDRGGIDRAQVFFRQALEIARDLHDRRGEGTAIYQLGVIAQDRGRLSEAESSFEEALTIFREVKDPRDSGSTLARLAYNAFRRGELDKAEGYYKECLGIYREVKDRLACGWALRSLGDLAQERGALAEADSYYKEALDIAQVSKDSRNEGIVLASLGSLAHTLGNFQQAADCYGRALEIARNVSNRRHEGIVLAAMGRVERTIGRHNEADTYYRAGLKILRELDDPINFTNAAMEFGGFLIEEGRPDEGCKLLAEVVSIQNELFQSGDQVKEMMNRLGCK